MHVFDQGIALEQIGDGAYAGELDRTWWIDFGPNGGFIASIMLHAIVSEVADVARHPRTLSVHYPGRAREGRFEIAVAIERKGRAVTFASARMTQEGRLLTTALCALSDDRKGDEFDDLPAPDVAGPDELQELPVPPGMLPRFARNFDYRFALGGFPYSEAQRAEIGGWIRPKDDRVVDDLMVPTFADAFPPAAFVRSSRPFPIPTIDLTVHFRTTLPLSDADADDWYLARFSSRFASAGFIEEDGEIWAGDGTLVAQSRQLAIHGTEMGDAPFP